MGSQIDCAGARRLDLMFPPGPQSGFTPSGIAGFSDLKPAAVVRELIQNSLDAAAEAEETTAAVRFQLTNCQTNDLPGIKAYRKALRAAVRTNEALCGGSLPSQAKRVVRVIRDALRGTDQEVLVVLDNGVGLNEARMSALLSDGVSAKGGSATGTFGNGHTVAIPASNLRYVLYGGVTADGSRIGAGHAVLASSVDPNGQEDYPTSRDGFLVRGFRCGSQVFAKGDSLPVLIAEQLDDIEERSTHGTAIIITAFNNFRKSRASLWDMVAKAAACNFFQAIDEDRLIVHFEDRRDGKVGGSRTLDRSNLRAVLEEHRHEQRSQAFLGGQRAYSAYDVFKSGAKHTVGTRLGKIQVRLVERSSGLTRVDLCRNGMWIADNKTIPGFHYAFQDRKPFAALLLLDSASGGKLHELVRNAEGPLHDKLNVRQRLLKDEAKDLRAALKEIKEWLRSVVPEVGSDNYSPDDFLALDFGGDSVGGRAERSFWGIPQSVTQRDPGYSRREWRAGLRTGQGTRGGSSNHSQRRPRKPVLRPLFQAASVPLGLNRRRIRLESYRECKDAELRLRVDENLDATCDSLKLNESQTVGLTRVAVGGREVSQGKLILQDGRVVGVRLGDLGANSSLDIDVSYELPELIPGLPGQEPVLRVDVFRSPNVGREEVQA